MLQNHFFQLFLKKNHQKRLPVQKKYVTLQPQNEKDDSVAQLVEQLTLNQWVEGSSPSGVTKKVG